jgi:ubiquinol-cytochrome c reductase iron-sulfur subunit
MTEPLKPRRDMLKIAAGAVVAGGAAAAAYVGLRTWAPGADVIKPTVVDFSKLEAGKQLIFKRNYDVWMIRHRRPEEIQLSLQVDVDTLPDRLAQNAMLPENAQATDSNRAFGEGGRYLIMSAICTYRFECVLLSDEGDFAARTVERNVGGFFCPCCGAHFDTLGRYRKGPGCTNLPIPKFKFLNATRIELSVDFDPKQRTIGNG